MPRRCFRVRVYRVVLSPLFAVGAIIFVGAGWGDPTGDPWLRVIVAPFAVISGVYSWRFFVSMVVRSNRHGVKFVNLTWTFRALWQDIDRFEAVTWTNRYGRRGMSIAVWLLDGRRLPNSSFYRPIRRSGKPNQCVRIADLLNADLVRARGWPQ